MRNQSEDNKQISMDLPKVKYFLIGIIAGFLLILVSILAGNNSTLLAIGIVLMGITTIVFPFCTPETVRLLGYEKSKWLGRILGVVLIFIGIWIFVK